MKKIILLIQTLTILTIFIAGIYPNNLVAQTDLSYTVLAPLPGTTECDDSIVGGDGSQRTDCKTTLEKYLPGMFKLLIGISAVWAVFMIVIGGFQYMTSDAITGKKEGLSKLQNSILGLFLVICSWLLLNTINPKLLELNLNIQALDFSKFNAGGTLKTPSNQTTGGGGTTTSGGPCTNCQYSTTATQPNQLSASDQARLNCSSCKPMDSSIQSASNNMHRNVDPDLNNRLVALNNELKANKVEWGVTEAFPPTVYHSSECHFTGSCVDAKPTNPSANNIKIFIESASKSGLRAQYEVRTVSEQAALITQLKNAGMTGDLSAHVIVVSRINGNHFSVYKK